MASLRGVSPRIYRHVEYLKISDKEREAQSVERIISFSSGEQEANWTMAFVISANHAKIAMSSSPPEALQKTHRVIFSIMDELTLSTLTLKGQRDRVTLCEDDFFQWKDVQTILAKPTAILAMCFDLISYADGELKPAIVTDLQTGVGEHYVTIVAAGKEFKTHKSVLIMKNHVFATMLSNLKRPPHNCVHTILIKNDVKSADAFGQMLRFMYSNECGELSVDKAIHLCCLADLYDVLGLASLCVDYLSQHIALGNCVMFWKISYENSVRSLERLVLDFLYSNIESALARVDCVVYLQRYISVHNIDFYVKLLQRHKSLIKYSANLTNLKRLVMDFIVEHYKQILKNDAYRQLFCQPAYADIILEINERIAQYIVFE